MINEFVPGDLVIHSNGWMNVVTDVTEGRVTMFALVSLEPNKFFLANAGDASFWVRAGWKIIR